MTKLEFTALVTLAVVVGNLIVNVVAPLVLKKFSKPAEPKPTDITLPTLLDYLNKMVELEFISVVEVPNYITEKNLVTDFEVVQTEIVKNVMNAFSSSFFKGANIAGVKQDYIITFVTRSTNAKLLGYMREHNFKLKK